MIIENLAMQGKMADGHEFHRKHPLKKVSHKSGRTWPGGIRKSCQVMMQTGCLPVQGQNETGAEDTD